jgi:hypothetical protein
MVKTAYDTKIFNFKQQLEKLFGVEDLSTINSNYSLFERTSDQNTIYHSQFYKWARTNEFIDLYESFIKTVVLPLYNEKIIYQAIPTFRICLPNNIAVGEYHKDKNYRDEGWASKVKEYNFFLPFTDAFDTNTIWVESEEDKGDYAPMNCNYGECIQWDGSNLSHGNEINVTGKTRVSVDFRVIAESNYIPSDKGSINTNTIFALGGYYK